MHNFLIFLKSAIAKAIPELLKWFWVQFLLVKECHSAFSFLNIIIKQTKRQKWNSWWHIKHEEKCKQYRTHKSTVTLQSVPTISSSRCTRTLCIVPKLKHPKIYNLLNLAHSFIFYYYPSTGLTEKRNLTLFDLHFDKTLRSDVFWLLSNIHILLAAL